VVALAFFQTARRSRIRTKTAAKDFTLFDNSFAVVDDAITIIVSAGLFRHWIIPPFTVAIRI
jgi:hypothetical protein